MNKKDTVDVLKRFSSIVIWGLKSDTNSTHRYIHNHFFTILKKLGLNVVWCNDEFINNEFINSNSLVIAYNLACKNLKYRKENYYALLNTVEILVENIDCKNYLRLRVYGEVPIDQGSDIWCESTIFNKQNHMLYQSWATDLLPEEFLSPIFSDTNKFYWVGSIWNDENNAGNIVNINILQEVLKRNNIEFIHCQNISDEENIRSIRSSRIAPAIGGELQVVRSMLPCRLWKNISYGQLGITNLPKSLDVFSDKVIFNTNIEELIDKSLSINEKEYKDMTAFQQEIVSESHTYLNWFYNVGRAFSELEIV